MSPQEICGECHESACLCLKDAGEPFRFKPLNLPRLRCAIDLLGDAANHTAGELHATARRDALDALVSLAANLGVKSRGQDVIRSIVTSAELLGVSEYELGVLRGQIIDELEKPYSHDRDTRTLDDEHASEAASG